MKRCATWDFVRTVLQLEVGYNGPRKLDTKTGGPKRQMSVRKKYPTDFKAKVVLEILKEEKS
ncbi:hypothetical protein, partial [Moorella stamsii (nom. illeg.)]|uniref:hypothetical protein n=1 Tax=Neomoorella stamsii TaxID=1266720 RepID=UPI001B8091BE